MIEIFGSMPTEKSPGPAEKEGEVEKESPEEAILRLTTALDRAEEVIRLKQSREVAKGYLPVIYKALIKLNRLDPEEVTNPLAYWNPAGDLTESAFNLFNRKRKILSNAIGILTASGRVRHDLNPDVPESFE